MSTLSIALVVSIERFRDPGLSWVVTAVIAGAVVTELIVGVLPDPDKPPLPPLANSSGSMPRPPVDELDEDGQP
jgi:hypothetical protein